MLEIVTKHQYWQLLDAQVDKKLSKAKFPANVLPWKKPAWHLKSVQDVIAFHYLNDPEGQNIGEIGGGDSRLLSTLARKNHCSNIEKFCGRDGGPTREVKIRKVRNVRAFVGEFSPQLEESSFDSLFSVSVVEHISNDEVSDFIRDCHRILKPNGRMVHLVDMYLGPQRTEYNESRAKLYRSGFENELFKPEREIRISSRSDLRFDESYCTNPDNIMYGWNQDAPNLRDVRETSQSVTLVWSGQAIKNVAD